MNSSELFNPPFNPNIYIDIDEFIETKIKLFSIYKSQVKAYPHPRSKEGLKILAKKRGLDVCLRHAEAFELIREIK